MPAWRWRSRALELGVGCRVASWGDWHSVAPGLDPALLLAALTGEVSAPPADSKSSAQADMRTTTPLTHIE